MDHDISDPSLPSFLRIGPPPQARRFRLAIIQLHITADKERNIRTAQEMVQRAARGPDGSKLADLVILPEHYNSPHVLQDLPRHAETINFVVDGDEDEDAPKTYDIATSPSQTVRALSAAAKEAEVWLIGGSIPERQGGLIFNTSVVFNPAGDLLAIHRRAQYFEAYNSVVEIEDGQISPSRSVPHVDTDFGRISLGLSWDVRFPEPIMIARHQGCLAIIYPGAYNFQSGPAHWRLLQQARANECQIYIAMCSPARDVHSQTSFQSWPGRACVVDPFGDVVAESDDSEAITYADIDPDTVTRARARSPLSTP